MNAFHGNKRVFVVTRNTPEEGSGPCGKGCKLCEFMLETKEVTDKRGKGKKIKGKMDCGTVGAIYGMWCKNCEKMVYVLR